MRDITDTYDARCRQEFEQIYRKVASYFFSIDIGCPYGFTHVATFHQATFSPLSERVMELFLAAGYRRNGDCLYTMHCQECQACIPIRLRPLIFMPNRNQKRSVQKNKDVEIELKPLKIDDENIELCERFLRKRYPRENNSARGYFHDFFLTSITSAAQLQFRVGGRLIGSSIVDIGDNWLNAVYFYFDPEEAKRSLGTFNIMTLVDVCLDWGVEYLYLGYLIEDVPAMSYKSNFNPHFLYLDKKWRQRGQKQIVG
ncbi:MAG: arginyl-tRNA--protein-N-Asp/Glu arginylyltransferase [Desulforhopalus sp.]|jgi:arginyl-tRNA--protein-N-Asp/Glu arginylyltransferase